MERKAKMYEMLKRGGGKDIPDNLREELLVEFDDPRRGRGGHYDSGSEDEYEDSGYRRRERFSSRGRRRSRSRSWSRSRSRSRSRSDGDWDRDESMRVARDPRDYKVCTCTLFSVNVIPVSDVITHETSPTHACYSLYSDL